MPFHISRIPALPVNGLPETRATTSSAQWLWHSLNKSTATTEGNGRPPILILLKIHEKCDKAQKKDNGLDVSGHKERSGLKLLGRGFPYL